MFFTRLFLNDYEKKDNKADRIESIENKSDYINPAKIYMANKTDEKKETGFNRWKCAIPSHWISQQNKMKVNRMLCLQMGKNVRK